MKRPRYGQCMNMLFILSIERFDCELEMKGCENKWSEFSVQSGDVEKSVEYGVHICDAFESGEICTALNTLSNGTAAIYVNGRYHSYSWYY